MTDAESTARHHKQLIREMIAGYAVANEIIEQERIERLRRMTIEQARADYAALFNFHQLFNNKSDQEGLRRIEDWHIQEKIAMRRAFETVARGRGLL